MSHISITNITKRQSLLTLVALLSCAGLSYIAYKDLIAVMQSSTRLDTESKALFTSTRQEGTTPLKKFVSRAISELRPFAVAGATTHTGPRPPRRKPSTRTASLARPNNTIQGGTPQGGGNTLTFGCSAYLISGADKIPSLPKKVQSIFVDTKALYDNRSLAAQLNKKGILPVMYVNAACEKRFGTGCPGPNMPRDGVMADFSEDMPNPCSQNFQNNIRTQLKWVRDLKGKYIEIDNTDGAINNSKCGKQAVFTAYKMAASMGISIVSKNMCSSEMLAPSNIVGAVLEPGSESANKCRRFFTQVGKPKAGVLIINRNGVRDPYTSYTKANRDRGSGGKEYTEFQGCTPNSAGLRLAGTPVYQGTGPAPTPASVANAPAAGVPSAPPVQPATPPPPSAAPSGGGGAPQSFIPQRPAQQSAPPPRQVAQ